MRPGQTECDAMTALQSVWTCAFLVPACVCVFRGRDRVCVCVEGNGALDCACVRKGGIKEDSHFWFGLRRVTGTRSSSGMLYWKQSSLTTNKPSQTVSLPSDDFFLAFFLLFVVKFRRGIQGFFFFFDILKAGFSFCSLGETANALDEAQKSVSVSL